MAIVISPKIRLVIADADTTDFNFAVNKATEISVLKGIKVDRSMLSMVGPASRVSATSNRVATSINTGYGSVNFTFDTYMKPVTDSGNVTSPEKLLWESLSATNVSDTATTSTVAFTSGNTNKLRELYFYIIFDDGSYYKISKAVAVSVNISLDIKQIAKASWSFLGLDLDYITTPATETSVKDLTSSTFIRNKLSTVSIDSYVLAILKGNIIIRNNVSLISRQRVGEILIPTGHYVGDRSSELNLSFYLDNKINGSTQLMSDLLAYTSLAGVNTLSNTTLSIGGTTNALKVDVNMPTSKIKLKNPTVGVFNTVDVTLIPQEATKGAGDEINLVYNN